ncbi:MAG: hypothetical protein PHT07_08810 [Paludibacter sp.]|nr:hypothetical protein [Paludibacter sp.]
MSLWRGFRGGSEGRGPRNPLERPSIPPRYPLDAPSILKPDTEWDQDQLKPQTAYRKTGRDGIAKRKIQGSQADFQPDKHLFSRQNIIADNSSQVQ